MRTTVSTDSVNPDSAGVAVVAFAAGGTVEALGAVGAGGALTPVLAAVLHNASSVAVVANSARLIRYEID
ncbi:hypothetical protein DK316_01615 [Mycobacterium tuberculosis]|nr:hypothetical protein DK316_01615 [Mycobacterium tuberculosis]